MEFQHPALKALEAEVERSKNLGSRACIEWQDITLLGERVLVCLVLTLDNGIVVTCDTEWKGEKIDDAKNEAANRILDVLKIGVGTSLSSIPTPGVHKISDKVSYYYDPESLLGNGQYSKVYRGFLESERRQMAVKIIKEKYIKDPRSNEIPILEMEHENLVKYYITEEKWNYYYIVLELADSRLDLWLELPRTNEQLVKICKNVATGLQHLHSKGFVHRDLKPNNVLIFLKASIATAKLSDYGISRKVDEKTGEWITKKGKKGAETYLPPEAYKPNEKNEVVLRKSFDMFPLGILFAFIMTNRQHLFALSKDDLPENIQSNIIKMKINWKLVSSLNLTSLRNLLEDKMIKRFPEERATIGHVLEHPFFLTNKEFYEAIKDVHLSVTNKVTDATKLTNEYNRYMKKYHPDTPKDWRLRLDPSIQKWLVDRGNSQNNYKKSDRERKKINGLWVTHLISFIKDQKDHYGVRRDHSVLSSPHLFGKDDCNYVKYFIQTFPELAFVLLDALPNCKIKKSNEQPQPKVQEQPKLSENLLLVCLYLLLPFVPCIYLLWIKFLENIWRNPS